MKFFWKIIALSTVLAILILFLPSILQAPSKIITNESSFGNAQAEEFILIGDTGTGSKEQYKVAESIKNYCARKNCKAVFILGDVIYDKGVASSSDKQFKTKFEDTYKELRLPYYIVLGNRPGFYKREQYPYSVSKISEADTLTFIQATMTLKKISQKDPKAYMEILLKHTSNRKPAKEKVPKWYSDKFIVIRDNFFSSQLFQLPTGSFAS